ncbi:unnamed protein product [Calicophoron daubneyi]|uniref:Uncharacterized protein n=1 Tax=Calicophoron daubneyi TaxID=300641 RepID=A0AAV2TMH6_CALDB
MDNPAIDFGSPQVHNRGFSHSTDAAFDVDIALTESLRRVPITRNISDLEDHEILTSSGIRQHVYVQPSRSKTALITYHDIGTNHTSFLGFFNYPEMRVISRHFTVYHICAPGHQENAVTGVYEHHRPIRRESCKSAETDVDVSLLDKKGSQLTALSEGSVEAPETGLTPSGGRFSLTGATLHYPTLDQLAQMITSILVHFGIKHFIGFGMGAGSNILARFALHNPDNVLGLFLLNPDDTTHAYYQRFRCRWWDLPYLQQGFLTDNLLDQLDWHWFGYGLAENEDVVRFYHQLARSLNSTNVAGYIQSYIDRTALNLVRPAGLAMPGETPVQEPSEPTVIQAEVMLLTGDRAVDLARALAEMNGHMDPKHTQFLTIPDCTGMVMEENPDKLAMDFLHFLRSIGLVINLTPEKLRQEAIADQAYYHGRAASESAIPARLLVGNEA